MAGVLCGCSNGSEKIPAPADCEEGQEDNPAESEDVPIESSNISGDIADINESTAQAWGVCGAGLTWYFQNHTLVIRGIGEMNDYSSSLDRPWHDLSDDIYSVYVEDGVASIGSCAFSYCGSLSDISIADSVTTIGYCAFSYCGSLTDITLPDSVTDIGFQAFLGCNSLNGINIPGSVHTIGKLAFYSCASLEDVIIEEGTTTISPEAFRNCPNLKSVIIPNSVTHIGDRAFYLVSEEIEFGFIARNEEGYREVGRDELIITILNPDVEIEGGISVYMFGYNTKVVIDGVEYIMNDDYF